ncbi:hypothetical protein ABPG72_022845 [Tetrahymena utriculariae]
MNTDPGKFIPRSGVSRISDPTLQFHQNPSWSPDINPIELIWTHMKHIFKKHNLSECISERNILIETVTQIWDYIPQKLINYTVDYLKLKSQMIIENKDSTQDSKKRKYIQFKTSVSPLRDLFSIDWIQQQCEDKEYISSDSKSCNMQIKNILVQKFCYVQEFISSDSKYCVKECADKQYISSDSKVCVKQCRENEIISSDAKSCVLQCKAGEYYNIASKECFCCKQGEYLSPDLNSCTKSCEEGEKISSNFKSCLISCKQGEYISSDKKYCLFACKIGEFISSDFKQCLVKCKIGELISSNNKNCVFQCQNGEYINSSNTQCASNCLNNQLISSDLKFCVADCNIGKFISFDGQTCLNSCPISQYISLNKKYCSLACQLGEFISSDQKYCTQLCKNNEFISQEGNNCLKLCPSYNYISSNRQLCLSSCSQLFEVEDNNKQCKKCFINEYLTLVGNQYICKAIQSLENEINNFKSLISSVFNQGINTLQALQQAQSQLDLYASTKYDKLLQFISDKQQVTSEDQIQIQSALFELFQISKQLLVNPNLQSNLQSLVVGTSQIKITSQVSKPGYRFRSSLNYSSLQSGDQLYLLEWDKSQNQSTQSQILQICISIPVFHMIQMENQPQVKNCQYLDQKYCGENENTLSTAQIVGITLSCIALVGKISFCTIRKRRKKQQSKQRSKAFLHQTIQTNNLITEKNYHVNEKEKQVQQNSIQINIGQ